ncbi:MAG: tetratricopeptide repeat protein [Opitutae bacterium]|nr:tetratricopeptide repeat protein [Opitutae bacterium]
MSQLPPANHSPEGAAPVYEPAFETAVHAFWARNRQGILIVCAAALLAIVGREAWQAYAASREQDVQAEYAKIADQTARLAAFAGAHPGHALAGVAWLRLADEKFTAGDYKTAATQYQKASGSLRHEVLLGRARLGAAISQLNGGDQAAGEAALKAIGADAALAKGARAEATYHLTSLAAAAGKADEVKKLADEVSKIDASSPWAQRATLLLTSSPAAAKPAATTDAGLTFKPTVTDKPPGK